MDQANGSKIVSEVQGLIDKIKNLEIENAQSERLRKYNGDLRKMIDEQAREINMMKKQNQQNGDDFQLIDISKEDKVVVQDPLEVPELLQLVMKHMDSQQQVLQSRLVCKRWNDSAMRIAKIYHPPNYMMISEQRLLLTEESVATPSQLVPDLEEFISLLRNSSCPAFLLDRLSTDGRTLALAKPQEFLKEFGTFINSIHIEKCLSTTFILKRLLTIQCINACDLEIEALEAVGIEMVGIEKWTTNLNRLTVDTPMDSIHTIRRRNATHVLNIIQCSPNLTFLKLHGNEEVSSSILRQLREIPEITIKFQELWITAGDGDIRAVTPLKMFLNIQVENQLKALTLSFEEEFNKVDFTAALHKISNNLEQLTILRTDYGDKDSNVTLGNGFPRLSNLKVLKFLATKWYNLKTRDVLDRLPNLEKLIVTGNYEEFRFMPELKTDQFLTVPNTSPRSHGKLKQLLLAGVIRDPSSLTNLSMLFPNIEKLYVCVEVFPMTVYSNELDFACARDKTAVNEKLKDIFQGLSKLTKLVALFINFGDFEWPGNLDFELAFEPLITLKSLHSLTFINGDEGGFPTENFTNGMLYFLKNCRGLQFLEFVNFKVRLPDASGFLSPRIDPTSTKLVKFSDRMSTDDFVDWIINKF